MSLFAATGTAHGEYPPVKITWLDSGMHIDHGWNSADKYLGDVDINKMAVITVGLLMQSTEEIIAVGMNHDEAHDAWIGVQIIATSNVLSMEYL